MKKIKPVALGMLVLWAGASASSDPMSVHFEGVVYTNSFSGTDVFDSGYSAGQSVTVDIEFDFDGGMLYDDKNTVENANYTNVIQSFWMDMGTEVLGGLNDDRIWLGNADWGDDIGFFHESPGGQASHGWEMHAISLAFHGNTDIYSDVSSLPSDFTSSDFDFVYATIWYENPNWDSEDPAAINEQFGGVTIVGSVVPEPATAMMLFFGGGVGFVIHRLRRWANR